MRKKKEKKNETIIREKIFCPICGSAAIRPTLRGFRCLNCKAIFLKPKRAKIELRKRPGYIG